MMVLQGNCSNGTQTLSLKGEGFLGKGEGTVREDPTEDVPTVTEPLINHLFLGNIHFLKSSCRIQVKKYFLDQEVLWLSTLIYQK